MIHSFFIQPIHSNIPNMIHISNRSSSFVRDIDIDLINKMCTVRMSNGNLYDYHGVSRRAMLNLLFNKNMSLGFWVNNNLLNENLDVKCLAWFKA